MKQQNMQFLRDFQVVHHPMDVPAKLVRQIESDAQALAVAMRAGGHKCASVAAAIGKSEGYVCRLRKGERPIPDSLVDALCRATNCNLIRQYRDLCDALSDSSERREVDRLAAMLRQQVAA